MCQILQNKNKHKHPLGSNRALEAGGTDRVKRKEEIGVYPGPVVSISINTTRVLLGQ